MRGFLFGQNRLERIARETGVAHGSAQNYILCSTFDARLALPLCEAKDLWEKEEQAERS